MSEGKAKVSSESSGEKSTGGTDNGLRLQVGDTLQMELLSDAGQSQQRYLVKVIGYVPARSILVTTPTAGNKVILMRVGQLMNVRLMGARRLIGFRATVLRTLFTPYPYLHLSYPQELSSVELRRTQRVTVQIICAVQNSTVLAKESLPAVILDLSVGGALLEAPRPLGIAGDAVAVAARLSIAQVERYLSLPGIIRTVQTVEGTGKNTPPLYQHGIEFLSMTPDTSLVLHGFVYEQIVTSLTGAI
ncbi:hypothetical protein CCP3SC1_1070009 [Gammaproteobacteria bacterium]